MAAGRVSAPRRGGGGEGGGTEGGAGGRRRVEVGRIWELRGVERAREPSGYVNMEVRKESRPADTPGRSCLPATFAGLDRLEI